jgi:SOS-response transcriptional repressor LexA
MAAQFTPRQGQFLAFIQGFTVKHGYAPSFEQIGAHFGVTPPSVNSMIKMLERRGLLSRLPGVARSLRVLVPAAALPGSEFGSRATEVQARGARVSALWTGTGEVAGAVAIAVLDAVMPSVGHAQANLEGEMVVRTAAQAVYTELLKSGATESEAAGVARRVGSEAARWESSGRGTVINDRRWVKNRGGRARR